VAAALLTADTSVVVPFLAAWHPRHSALRNSMVPVTRLPGHVLAESMSSLTRMPSGFAVSAEWAAEALLNAFRGDPLVLAGEDYRALVEILGDYRVTGGAVYDALVATTAKLADARLLTRDRRAERTYRSIGVDYELLD